MTSKVLMQAGKMALNAHQSKNGSPPEKVKPKDHPFYYYDVVYDRDGYEKVDRKGKVMTKKRRKDERYYVELLGIPEKDARVLLKMKRRAKLMDGGGDFIGIKVRFGLSTVLTFCAPEIGNFIDFAISQTMVARASKISDGLGAKNRSLMMGAVVRDMLIGTIPFAGAVINAFYRANTRNAIMLEKILVERVKLASSDSEEKLEIYDPHDDVLDEEPRRPHPREGRTDSAAVQYEYHSSKKSKSLPVRTRNDDLRGSTRDRNHRRRDDSSPQPVNHRASRSHAERHGGGPGGRFVSARDL